MFFLAESHLFLCDLFSVWISPDNRGIHVLLILLVMLVTRAAGNLVHRSFVVRDASFGTFAILDVIVYVYLCTNFFFNNFTFV